MSGIIETYSGIAFCPTEPKEKDVNIEDIAHALSQICRFNGHTKHFYSVAQHSINCAKMAARIGATALTQLNCLLHDASEAYLCDVPSPIKPELEGYKVLESKVQGTILKALSVATVNYEVVDYVDKTMLAMEAKALMPCKVWEVKDYLNYALYFDFDERKPEAVKVEFLRGYKNLINSVQFGKVEHF